MYTVFSCFNNAKVVVKNAALEYIYLKDIYFSQNSISDYFKGGHISLWDTILLLKNQTDYYKNVDYFLFDYKPKKSELPGGNAKKFDWSILKKIQLNKPWFLSGGINETNINLIKNTIKPDGIDLSSGVEESLGIKSEKKIKNFINKYYAI